MVIHSSDIGSLRSTDGHTGLKQGGQALIGGLDVTVARNFFGAQVSHPRCMRYP